MSKRKRKNYLKDNIKELKHPIIFTDDYIIIGLPVSRLNRDYIGNIKRGITYKREVSMILGGDVQRLDNFYRRD